MKGLTVSRTSVTQNKYKALAHLYNRATAVLYFSTTKQHNIYREQVIKTVSTKQHYNTPTLAVACCPNVSFNDDQVLAALNTAANNSLE